MAEPGRKEINLGAERVVFREVADETLRAAYLKNLTCFPKPDYSGLMMMWAQQDERLFAGYHPECITDVGRMTGKTIRA